MRRFGLSCSSPVRKMRHRDMKSGVVHRQVTNFASHQTAFKGVGSCVPGTTGGHVQNLTKKKQLWILKSVKPFLVSWFSEGCTWCLLRDADRFQGTNIKKLDLPENTGGRRKRFLNGCHHKSKHPATTPKETISHCYCKLKSSAKRNDYFPALLSHNECNLQDTITSIYLAAGEIQMVYWSACNLHHPGLIVFCSTSAGRRCRGNYEHVWQRTNPITLNPG